jgi:NADH-quinone oxidoreductase subunit J
MRGQVTFFILAGLAIFGAMATVTRRKAIYAFLYFTFTLLAISGIFLQLHAPLLLAAQLIVILCALLGIILFSVEVAKLDVTLAAERDSALKSTFIVAAISLALLIVLALLQHHFLLPGENVAALMPQRAVTWPPIVSELIRFFFTYDLLPLGLMLLLLLITAVGIRVLYLKRA